jgi:hypothetical protein
MERIEAEQILEILKNIENISNELMKRADTLLEVATKNKEQGASDETLQKTINEGIKNVYIAHGMDSAIDLFRNALVIKRLKIRDQGLYIHSYDKEYIAMETRKSLNKEEFIRSVSKPIFKPIINNTPEKIKLIGDCDIYETICKFTRNQK